MLLGHNANVEARDNHNRSPLHHTAWHNSREVTQLLLKHNAYIEARDKDNQTPLHFTAYYNNIEVAKMLLEHNADMEARDKDNRTPLDLARISWRNTEAVISLLMERAANTS